jgi:hypothetical protein
VGYFHNIFEKDPDGVRMCYLIPQTPNVGSDVPMYEVICARIPSGKRSGRSGVFTYVKALGTDAWTMEELERNFLGAGSDWAYLPYF